MTDDITATFTVEELVLFKGGLEKLRFQGDEQDRERVWVLIKKVDGLLPITKIRPSDGCGRDAVLLAVGRWHGFHEFGGNLGNVG